MMGGYYPDDMNIKIELEGEEKGGEKCKDIGRGEKKNGDIPLNHHHIE